MNKPSPLQVSSMEDSDAAAAAAPESWEMADLDATLGCLLISSRAPTRGPPSDDEFGDDLPPPAIVGTVGGGGRGRAVSEEDLSQVDQFLREALEKPRERLSVLRMEQDIERFIRDPTKQELEFLALPTSYLRLAAHRVAQYYCLQSVAVPDDSLPDGSGSRIVIRKTTYCRFPAVRLSDIPVNLPLEHDNGSVKFAIKQRPHRRSHNSSNVNTQNFKGNHQKSVEVRKEEYNRARARIFNGNGGVTAKSEEISLPDTFPLCPAEPERIEEKFISEVPDINYLRSSSNASTSANKSSRIKVEKEPVVSRYRPNSRVAIFRDREVDRKDPDYDRSYDRYMQRFDPGFGFSGGPYGMQAMYSPAVNYNTEFPQLGSVHGPPISHEHQHHTLPQHMRAPWPLASAPNTLCYHPREGMSPSFNPNHINAHQTSSVYLPSQYSIPPPHTGMSYMLSQDNVHPFVQQQQQQPESFAGPGEGLVYDACMTQFEHSGKQQEH